MSILDHFYGVPRQQQQDALLELERSWSSNDVFVIRAPTGTGKSRIAHCIANWTPMNSSIITPNNMLVDQYMDELPGLHTIKPWRRYRGGREEHAQAKALGFHYPTVMNYMAYMSKKIYNPVLIIDEAHNTIPWLIGEHSSLWYHLYGIPEDIESTHQLVEWYQDVFPTLDMPLNRRRKVNKIMQAFLDPSLDFIPEVTWEPYRNNICKVWKFTPARIGPDWGRVLWPNRVKKVILMSATLIENDIVELGLDRRRVKFIDVTSPIPADRRPVRVTPIVPMSYTNRDKSTEELAKFIIKTLSIHKDRGIVHVTYNVAAMLRNILGPLSRIMYHTKQDKKDVYNEWLNSKDGVLIACGMQEGIDLKDDRARWQIIAKIPFPPLTSTAVQHRMKEDKVWYNWSAIKVVLQAAGRICRNPDDYGITYITDACFSSLYKNNLALFPPWFRDAVGR